MFIRLHNKELKSLKRTVKMENYEKFEQMIEDSGNAPDGSDPELESMFQIVQSLKSDQPHPSYKAQSGSKQLMLEEAKRVAEASKTRRLSVIGSLYGWAVPAILLLAVVGAVVGNSQRSGGVDIGPETIESGSAPVLAPADEEPIEESEEDVLSPEASTIITSTEIISDSAAGEAVVPPVPEDLVAYPDPAIKLTRLFLHLIPVQIIAVSSSVQRNLW